MELRTESHQLGVGKTQIPSVAKDRVEIKLMWSGSKASNVGLNVGTNIWTMFSERGFIRPDIEMFGRLLLENAANAGLRCSVLNREGTNIWTMFSERGFIRPDIEMFGRLLLENAANAGLRCSVLNREGADGDAWRRCSSVTDRSLSFPAFCNALQNMFSEWTKLLVCTV